MLSLILIIRGLIYTVERGVVKTTPEESRPRGTFSREDRCRAAVAVEKRSRRFSPLQNATCYIVIKVMRHKPPEEPRNLSATAHPDKLVIAPSTLKTAGFVWNGRAEGKTALLLRGLHAWLGS